MAQERTLSIIKPDAVGKNVIGQIYSRFEQAGLKIVAAKMKHLSRREAEEAARRGADSSFDPASFRAAYAILGAQRATKVAGIFARLHHRDGKSGYLEDAPRFLNYIRTTCRRYDAFKPLLMGKGESIVPEKLAAPYLGLRFEWFLYLVGLLAVAG